MKTHLVLAHFWDESILLLIPKKNDKGYLKQPVGGHRNALCKLCEETFFYDVSGFDGHLVVHTGRIFDREKLIETVIKPIASYCGTDFKVVDENIFWSNHPNVS
ncbi:hypothetical protein [Iodobacter fluviatilis]|uniref:C2H2-type domain-containing protein n=1 Tax=Iodobacter fluviatilis TaxID=537 RepID=A0A7G3GFH5_9NEIS|nr:hypothetical protein [Iodobacter fluviatilis]QBC45862.1 hypothetical protein C1H71_20175 [Iodobacter fluviatilis]